MKLARGIEIDAPNEEPTKWRIKVPIGETFLVLRLDALGAVQMDLSKTPFDGLQIVRANGQLLTAAIYRARPWFNELGERNRDTQVARKSGGNGDE